MTELTLNERLELEAISARLAELRQYVNTIDLAVDDGLDAWFTGIERMKAIQGNTSNDMSFVACLLAKRYLVSNHNSVLQFLTMYPIRDTLLLKLEWR